MIENPRTHEAESLTEEPALAAPALLTEHCGKDSAFLMGLGLFFDLCDREPGHPGFCEFIAL